jgi:hypothetical protein
MSKQTDPPRSSPVAADPSKWSPKSQQSVAFQFKRVYVDEPYVCRRCGRDCVFTAQDQKYTFEIKKARIDQRRLLCAECWSESHRVRAALTERESRWAENRAALSADPDFLRDWLDLLLQWEAFNAYKVDTARINMLRRLLKLDGPTSG